MKKKTTSSEINPNITIHCPACQKVQPTRDMLNKGKICGVACSVCFGPGAEVKKDTNR